MGKKEISGILCNDASGLCLASQGHGLVADEQQDSSSSVDTAGVYTNLVRLAAQLHPENAADATPLITIETEETTIYCKEYHGHAVAVAVPVHTNQQEEGSHTHTNNGSSSGSNVLVSADSMGPSES